MKGIESSTGSRRFTHDRQPRFAPSLEASLHVRHIESGSLQDARGDRGSSAAQTLRDDWLGLVDTLDLAKQLAKKPVFGCGDVPVVELCGGPHIE